MRITTTKTLPTAAELVEILKKEFSPDYSYTIFGLGKNKTVLVKKSALVGVQVSLLNNDISIQASPPSIGTGYLFMFFSYTGLGAFIALVCVLLGMIESPLIIEKEIGSFLKRKYA